MRVCWPASLVVLVAAAFPLRAAPATRPATQPASQPSHDVRSLLPADGSAVDVMGVKVSPRYRELAMKFQQAVARNPEWFKVRAAQARTGEPLLYDARLGMTADEYAEFRKLMPRMTTVHTVKCGVTHDRERITVRFADLPNLDEVTLDLKADAVHTPMGIALKCRIVEATDDQKMTGPWSGVEWFTQDIDQARGTKLFVTLAVGRLTESGRGILYYNARNVEPAGRTEHLYILTFDLPAKGHGDSQPAPPTGR